jgi:hypothetical protein
MRRPIKFDLHNGETILVDGERVLAAAFRLLESMYVLGCAHEWDCRLEPMQMLSDMLPLARELGGLHAMTAQRVPIALMNGLDDLERGHVPPLFRRATPRRVARDSRREWCLRAIAAGCLEVLIAAKVPDEEARVFVARILQRCGFRLGRVHTPGPKVVADWRKRFRENDQVAPEDLEAYRNIVEGQRVGGGESIEALTRRIELLLSEMLRLYGYTKKRA